MWILTPQQAETVLPVVCYLVYLGIAQPVFKQGHRAHPSGVVQILKVRESEIQIPVDLVLDGRQWRNVVVPILESEDWDPRTNLNRALGRVGYLSLLGREIRRSMDEHGWGL